MDNPNTLKAGDLTRVFDIERQEVTGETLEQIRDNYYIAAKMNGSDDSSVGGLNINASGRQDSATLAKKKEKQATSDMIMMALLDSQLAEIESAMIDKYGEDFAEQLAADLLDEDTYSKLMEIEDPEERRRAIAKAINDGIENGTIDPDKIYDNPDVKDWLDAHAEREHGMSGLDYSKATIAEGKKRKTPMKNPLV